VFRITNGKIVTEHEILEGYDVVVRGDLINEIIPAGQLSSDAAIEECIDARGGYVTPGFIDLHSDYIEHMAAPRPTSLMEFELSLRETEKQLIAHGITTMFHSLSLAKPWEFDHKPIRDPQNVRKFIDLIHESHSRKHLVRHRFHARFEVDNLEQIDNLRAYLAENKVHLISFMDHTPGQGQYRNLELYRNTVKGYKNVSDDTIDQIIMKHQHKEKMTAEKMEEIAQLSREFGVAIASHDDDSLEKLDVVKSFGTTISEFPITMDIAKYAKSLGLFTIAGAPNVLLGGSHSGNLNAAEAIQSGFIDILCSDYYPAAMLHAIFNLYEKYGLQLVELFKLVTITPARAVGMDLQIGSIAKGKKADLLIIEQLENQFPVITSVWVDGHWIQRTNYRV
jgi:phosphonate metabolism protein PhnM